MGLPSERDAARATITSGDMQVALIDEGRHFASLDTASLGGACLDTAGVGILLAAKQGSHLQVCDRDVART